MVQINFQIKGMKKIHNITSCCRAHWCSKAAVQLIGIFQFQRKSQIFEWCLIWIFSAYIDAYIICKMRKWAMTQLNNLSINWWRKWCCSPRHSDALSTTVPMSAALISHRDHSMYAPSQWEMALHCNAISHWLCAYTQWSLSHHQIVLSHTIMVCFWHSVSLYPTCDRWSLTQHTADPTCIALVSQNCQGHSDDLDLGTAGPSLRATPNLTPTTEIWISWFQRISNQNFCRPFQNHWD